MTITRHVIKRFQERITSESSEVVRLFIESDIKKSTLLYRLNNFEKRIYKDIIYVLDYTKGKNPTVVTLYLTKNY